MITLDSVAFSYARTPLFHDLSLHIETGGFYAVMGPNGCGKTTLLRLISGLRRPLSGTVSVGGRPLSDYSPLLLARQIAFVQQQMPSDFEFSAFDTVLMGRNPYQKPFQNESLSDRAIVEEAMRQTSVWHLRSKLPSQMSGGELQRVMIARALAQQTPVILLDEPTSNLDISHQFDILALLARINRDLGKTILVVLHDLNLAYTYCPSLLLLSQGRLLFQGSAREGLSPDRIRNVFGVSACIRDGHILLSQDR